MTWVGQEGKRPEIVAGEHIHTSFNYEKYFGDNS